jgi:hypothetical protein
MADYVRKTILSQGYAHIEGVKLNAQQKEDFEVTIAEYQKPRAKVLLGREIIPEVRTEDGSLKVYTTVYGSLSDALGSFDIFMVALNSLYGSSKMLADACNLESLFLSRAKKKALIRAEARTGVVRSTKDLFDRVIYLAEGRQQESNAKITKNLADLDKKIIFLNDQLTYGRDKELVWKELIILMHELRSKIYKSQATVNDERLKEHKSAIEDMIKRLERYRLQGDVE